jgi:hypothetical protein
VPESHPADRQGQERARSARRVEKPLFRIARVTYLVEHVLGQPAGRVVFAELVPQPPRDQGLVQVRQRVVRAAVGLAERPRVVGGNPPRQAVQQVEHGLRTDPGVPRERVILEQVRGQHAETGLPALERLDGLQYRRA